MPSPSKSPATGSSPVNTDAVGPTPFPVIKKGLRPRATPQQPDCAYNLFTAELMKLTSLLNELGVSINLSSPHINSLKLGFCAMEKYKLACTYYTQQVGDINPGELSGKIGSTTNASRRFTEEYKAKEMIGIILNNWDKFDNDTLNLIEKHIERCYSIISERFEKGDFWAWVSNASIDDCHQWEEREGLSIFFMIWMELVLKHNGKEKYNVRKNLHIRLLEIANQLHYRISNGAMMEQLHYSHVWDKYINPNHNAVKESTGRLMEWICANLGVSASKELLFELHSVSVSWEHGMTLNSKQELKRKLQRLFADQDIGKMSREDMVSILAKEKVHGGAIDDDEDYEGYDLSIILENISDEDLEKVDNVHDLIQLVFDAEDEANNKNLLNSSTETDYDFVLGEKDSFGQGMWRNPYPDRPTSEDAYNADDLDHAAAREDNENTIRDLKRKVDEWPRMGQKKVCVGFMVSHFILPIASTLTPYYRCNYLSHHHYPILPNFPSCTKGPSEDSLYWRSCSLTGEMS